MRESVLGVNVYRYPSPMAGQGLPGYLWEYGYSMLAAFFLALQVWATRGFDVIHAHNPPDTFVIIAAFFKLLGKRFIFDHHDLSPEMYHARFNGHGNATLYRALVLFEKLSCRLADRVIATNQSYRAIEIERGGVSPERITIVRNGPDLERMRLMEPDPAVRARASTIIGYAGVLGFQDGLDYLLRALHHLRQDVGRQDFFAVIIGRGDALEYLKDLASELDLNEHVWFPGWVSDTDYVKYLSTAESACSDPSNPLLPLHVIH